MLMQLEGKWRKINLNEQKTETTKKHNTICTFKRKKSKNSQGILILRQVTIKHSLQSVMYTWH